MTQTISSRKRTRDLEDTDLLPSPKRIDFNFNSALHVNNHLNGNDEVEGLGRILQNGACYDGQPASVQPLQSPGQQTAPPILQHVNNQCPTNGWSGTHLDSSTCTALSNLHLMSRDHIEVPSCSNSNASQPCDNSAYRDINRVLRDAHFSRLSRLDETFREVL